MYFCRTLQMNTINLPPLPNFLTQNTHSWMCYGRLERTLSQSTDLNGVTLHLSVIKKAFFFRNNSSRRVIIGARKRSEVCPLAHTLFFLFFNTLQYWCDLVHMLLIFTLGSNDPNLQASVLLCSLSAANFDGVRLIWKGVIMFHLSRHFSYFLLLLDQFR